MNARIFLTIFLAVALSGCSVFGVQNVSEPAYTVELEDGAIEIRRYTDILIAETKVKAGYEDMGKEGFRRLSGYIFGKNEREQEISMTAPVLQEGGGEEWSMSFVMPESVTEANAPIPNDEQVNLIKVPGKRVADAIHDLHIQQAPIIAENATDGELVGIVFGALIGIAINSLALTLVTLSYHRIKTDLLPSG